MSATMFAIVIRAASASVGAVTTAVNAGIAGVSVVYLSEVVFSGGSVVSISVEMGCSTGLEEMRVVRGLVVLLADELALSVAV